MDNIRKELSDRGIGKEYEIDGSNRLYCQTSLMLNQCFWLDLNRPKADLDCPGANYVCFGYADLVFDPVTNRISLDPKVVVLDLDMLPWTPPLPEGKVLERYMTMGYLYGNPDRWGRAAACASDDIQEIVQNVLKDITGSSWALMTRPRTPDFVLMDKGRQELKSIVGDKMVPSPVIDECKPDNL